MRISIVIYALLLAITQAWDDTDYNGGGDEIRGYRYPLSPCYNWCRNGGTCHLTAFGPRCFCLPYYKGDRCQYKYLGSPPPSCDNWCKNGGTCRLTTRGRRCTCLPYYRGNRCQRRVVNGNWGEWGQFDTCTTTCGCGLRTRSRLCNNPHPANGGADCPGFPVDAALCDQDPCPEVGNWGQWGQWSSCSKTCETGTRNRTRACDGGTQCSGPCTETMECNTGSCPVDGNWGQWGEYSPCSSTCGTAARARHRLCNNPPPANGGAPCPGASVDVELCDLDPCSVDGNWGQWGPWSACFGECGTITRNRTRACDSPPPSNGGAQCPGPDTESMECGLEFCVEVA